MNTKTKTYDEFLEKYELEYNQVLLKNKPNDISPDDIAPFGGCMYETFGDEVQYVVKQPINTIWTIVENDEGNLEVIAGFWRINRFGYLISKKVWVDNNECFLID
jgi:hypothetical protein